MDVWHRTMGLRQQLKYYHLTKMPIKNTPIYGRRATVRIKLHATQRSRHPIHQRYSTRKKHQTSQPFRGTSQRTSAATPGKAKQKKAKKTRRLKRHLPIDLKWSRRCFFAAGGLILPLEGIIIFILFRQISPYLLTPQCRVLPEQLTVSCS